MENKNIGFAITGSFCTVKKVLPYIETFVRSGNNVFPILSYAAASYDTRFIKAQTLKDEIKRITGREIIETIVDAEPIGPKNMLDILIIAPCTGNTLAKLNSAITDTPVLMAAKAHLRNNKPLLLAIATNDGLSGNAKNIGELLNKKNIFFVPFTQDDNVKKCFSLVSDFALITSAAEKALEGKQLQPLLINGYSV
jgi:dipicolinate synthase subunit B